MVKPVVKAVYQISSIAIQKQVDTRFRELDLVDDDAGVGNRATLKLKG